MNNRHYFTLIISLIPLNIALANCDISHFPKNCELPVTLEKKPTASSLVYCGKTFIYLNREEYEILSRLQRDNINITLNINGEYIDSPCMAAEK